MKFSALSLFLAALPLATAQVSQDEFRAIESCCDDGCQDACDWVEEERNKITRPSGAIGGFGVTSGGIRHLQSPSDLVNQNCCVNSGGGGGDPHILVRTLLR